MPLEWAAVAAIGTLAGGMISFATFWLTFGGRISKAEADADSAKKMADDSLKSNAVLTAAFALYREQVAKDYIHREVMREVEDRLTQAIERLGDRLDRFTEAAISAKPH